MESNEVKPLTPAETIELEYFRNLLAETSAAEQDDIAQLIQTATDCVSGGGMEPMKAVTGLLECFAVRLKAARRELESWRMRDEQWAAKWRAAIDLLPAEQATPTPDAAREAEDVVREARKALACMPFAETAEHYNDTIAKVEAAFAAIGLAAPAAGTPAPPPTVTLTPPGDGRQVEEALREARTALRMWVEYFARLDRDEPPGDTIGDLRRGFHAKRMTVTRTALAKLDAARPEVPR